MKTYIINLEHSAQRREHIVAEVDRIGLEYEIVKAVDGSQLSSQDFDKLCDMETVRKFPQWLSPGMIGASLSHRLVYSRIIENNDRAALVIEDDAILPDSLAEIVAGISSVIMPNEVILLYYSSFEPLQLSTVNAARVAEKHTIMYPMFLKGVVGAVCYVITNQAAKNMVDGVMPIAAAPDSWIDFTAKGMFDSIRCVYPMDVGHLGVKSVINATAQGKARRWLTEFVERNKIPIFYEFLIRIRKNQVLPRTSFTTTDLQSPLDPGKTKKKLKLT
jgi:glycosyl transferase family 25